MIDIIFCYPIDSATTQGLRVWNGLLAEEQRLIRFFAENMNVNKTLTKDKNAYICSICQEVENHKNHN